MPALRALHRLAVLSLLLALVFGTPSLYAQPTALPEDPGRVSFLEALELSRELYRLWGTDPAAAVQVSADLNTLFEPHLLCWRSARLSMALLAADTEPELLAAVGGLGVATLSLHQRRGEVDLALEELHWVDELTDELGDHAQTAEHFELFELLTLQVAAIRTQLRDAESLFQAQRSLDAFLDPRPDHTLALRLRGHVDELQGQHARAAEFFRRAVALAPGATAARLRLALNLLRSGDGAHLSTGAGDILRDLATGPGDSWVTVVAAQEAVRYLSRGGHRAEALAFIDGLAETVTTDPDLVLLADFLGRPPDGDLPVVTTRPDPDDHTPDPRYLYDRGPADVLERASLEHQPRLAEAAARLARAAAALHRDPAFLRDRLHTLKTTRKALSRCPYMLSSRRRNVAVGSEAPMP